MTRRAQHFREEAAEFFWPTRCVGCNMPGALLCPSCEEELPWIDQRWSCPLCGAPYGWLTCTECDRSRDNDAEGEPRAHEEQLRAHWPARAAICAFPFDGTPAHMVTLLKDAHELRLAPLMADALVRALEDARDVPALDGRPRFASEDIDAVCFVPATPAAYARRGFDHMELVSKERSCVCDEVDCRSSSCPRADGHYDRINGALRDLLDGAEGGEPITAEKIADCAEKHRVCPYELSLDAADFSDVIICDYNYVFHPRVRLTRFFGDTEAAGKKNGTILLVDEAHNLLERGREMYSAEISAREVKQFRRSVRDRQPQLWKTLKDLVRVLNGMEKEAALKSVPGKSAPGAGGEICTFLPGELDPGLSTALQRVRDRIRWILEQDRRSEVLYTSFISGSGEYEGEDKRGQGKTEPDTDGTGTGNAETDADIADINITDIKGKDKKGKNKKENNKTGNSRADTGKTQELLEFYFEITRFHEVLEMLDEHYIVYSVNKPARREGGGFNLHLYCADPSARLQNCEAASVSTICFSATFLPIQYYKGLLGGTGDDFEMYARSSFAPDQREVVIVKDVTSRYRDRRADNYERIARGIRQIAACRPGNYMVYFPSYAFLENVQEAFTRIFGIAAGSAEGTDDPEESREGITLLTQKPRMDDEERVSFLKAFENPRSGCSLIGFCVLGGMFGEGIDLRNDRLIGCLIVGTGIPPVEPRRELLREYFSSRGRNGYDYAYRFPGMNKVLQAAGRVIRTAEDAGVVALMDERFAERENRELFPPEWGIPREADSGGAAVIVSSFWENFSRGMKEGKVL